MEVVVSNTSKEMVYLFNEECKPVLVLDSYAKQFKIKGDFGCWLACVRVSQNVFSAPVLFELRYASEKGYKTYKISAYPPEMVKKGAFLKAIELLSNSLKK